MDAPPPVISYRSRHRKAIGGHNRTATNNPAEYQGLKFSTSNGAPATPELTQQIEANIARLQADNWTMKAAPVGTFACKTFDPRPAYFTQIRKLADFATIRAAKLKAPVELMYATGPGSLNAWVKEAAPRTTRSTP